jgi:hypothetical protein
MILLCHKYLEILTFKKNGFVCPQSPGEHRIAISNITGKSKSFVDDLNRELGIVRTRVAFAPRSAEIKPALFLSGHALSARGCRAFVPSRVRLGRSYKIMW